MRFSLLILFTLLSLVITLPTWATVERAFDDFGRLEFTALKRPNTVSFAYDENGNMTGDGRRSFEYDDENQLKAVQVTGAWRSEFVYDGFGRMRRRIEKMWNGIAFVESSEIHYIYDGLRVLQERDGNDNPLVTYTRGLDLSGSLGGAGGIGGLLARTDASGTAYYHSDLGGNVTAMAKELVNQQGGRSHVLVAKYLYDPFGNQLGQWGPLAEANKYRFSSKEYHANSQLYYYGGRWYEPELQRWMNRDPLGESFDANLYRFVYNSPVSYVDPNGEIGILATGAIGAGIGAAVGAGVALFTDGNVLQGALHGALVGGIAGLGGGIGSALAGGGTAAAILGGALGGGLGDAAGQGSELALGWRCEYDLLQTAISAGLGGLGGGLGSAFGRAAKVAPNTTRLGITRNNPAVWRATRDLWDNAGYGDILSDVNRAAIARGRTPVVDQSWINHFPEDAGLLGERIPMHHIGGGPITVPLPATRHLDAHMPGGFRYNPGGPGSAVPVY